MGFRTQSACFTVGTDGRWRGRKAQWLRGSGSGSSPAGALAPSAIQRVRSVICSELNGCPSCSGGMRSLASALEVRWIIADCSAFPTTSTGPFFPPRSIPATVSSRRPAFCCRAPWQDTHRSRSRGFSTAS